MATLWKYTPHTEGDNSFTRRSVIRPIQTSGIVAKTQVLPFSLIRGSAFCLRLQGVKKKKEKRKATTFGVKAQCHASLAQFIIVHQFNTYFHPWICGHAHCRPGGLVQVPWSGSELALHFT